MPSTTIVFSNLLYTHRTLNYHTITSHSFALHTLQSIIKHHLIIVNPYFIKHPLLSFNLCKLPPIFSLSLFVVCSSFPKYSSKFCLQPKTQFVLSFTLPFPLTDYCAGVVSPCYDSDNYPVYRGCPVRLRPLAAVF